MKRSQIFAYSLASLVIIGFFITMVVMFTKQVPEGNKEAFYLLVGCEVSALTTIVNYFFGSSLGSAAKTELLAQKDNG